MILNIFEATSVYRKKLLIYLELLRDMEKKYNLKESDRVDQYFLKLSNHDWQELSTKSKELVAIEEVLGFTKEDADFFLKEAKESLKKK